MAPESVVDKIYSSKSDVWSWGVTIWELFARAEPYSKLSAVETMMEVTKGLRLIPPENIPDFVKEYLQKSWELDPRLRPSVIEIKFTNFWFLNFFSFLTFSSKSCLLHFQRLITTFEKFKLPNCRWNIKISFPAVSKKLFVKIIKLWFRLLLFYFFEISNLKNIIFFSKNLFGDQ